LQAAIEALDRVREDGRPADRVLHDYFRDRRYIGGKDRRAISDLFWSVQRSRARLAADCALAEGRNPTDAVVRAESGRRLMMAFCARMRVEGEADLALFTGQAYAPVAVSPREQDWITALRQVKPSERPDWAWAETPQWLWPRFLEIYGDAREAEVAAARAEGSVDLRVNALKASREDAAARLAAEGVETDPMRHSPIGLRCRGRANVAATEAFKDGWVEVQDESAQLAALLVGAKPGDTVVDFCAGAGGKTWRWRRDEQFRAVIAATCGRRAGTFRHSSAPRRGVQRHPPRPGGRNRQVGEAPQGHLRSGAGGCAVLGLGHLAAQPGCALAGQPGRTGRTGGVAGADSGQRGAAGAPRRAAGLRHLLDLARGKPRPRR
jgi:hypothetical protein